jgi:transposase-like protein
MGRTNNKKITELMAEDKDLLRDLVKAALQEVLEAEMSELLGAAVGDLRNPLRVGETRGGDRSGR